jgi:protein-S-isoprenylcysteine O-methyltransferase Ste14
VTPAALNRTNEAQNIAMEFAEIIFHILLLLFFAYIAVVVLLLFFFAGANLLYQRSGKPALFQALKQRLLPGETNANFILHLAWRMLVHAVLFAAFVALLIDIKIVQRQPLFMSLVAVIFLARVAEVFSPGTAAARHYRKDEDQSRLTSWVLGLSFFTNVLAPILESRYKFGPALPPAQWWNWLGLLLFAAGSIMRLWAIRHTGAGFFPHVKVDAKLKLVTGGPYAQVRHPSYLGLLVSYLGFAFLFNSLIGAIALAVLAMPAVVLRILKEEHLLSQQFGDAWKKYQIHTPSRLLPKLW